MSYTTPPTFVAADILTAADLNILTDDIIDLDGRVTSQAFSGIHLTRSSDLSTADNTSTDVPWSTDPIDIDGWWSTGATVTVPAAAVPDGATTIAIRIDMEARFASNSTGVRTVRALVNGSVAGIAASTGAVNGDTTLIEHWTAAIVAAGDTIKMQVVQSSGGTLAAQHMQMLVTRLGTAS